MLRISKFKNEKFECCGGFLREWSTICFVNRGGKNQLPICSITNRRII